MKPNGCSFLHFFLSSFNLALAIPDILMRKMRIKRLGLIIYSFHLYNTLKTHISKASSNFSHFLDCRFILEYFKSSSVNIIQMNIKNVIRNVIGVIKRVRVVVV